MRGAQSHISISLDRHLPGCTGTILGALFGFTFSSAMSVSCAEAATHCGPLGRPPRTRRPVVLFHFVRDYPGFPGYYPRLHGSLYINRLTQLYVILVL